MALLNSFVTGLRDTSSLVGGIPNRLVAVDGMLYLVARSASDNLIHILKVNTDDAVVTDYPSIGVTLDSGTTPSMLAAAGDRDGVIHIVYLTVDDGTKLLNHVTFDPATATWDSPETVLTSSAALASDSLNMVMRSDGSVYVVAWIYDGSAYDLRYARYNPTTLAWTSEEITANQATAPAYIPQIAADEGGNVMVLADDGTGGLAVQDQWTAWGLNSGSWSSVALDGLGQATLVALSGGAFHALFFGDKRHTVLHDVGGAIDSTIGAVEYEMPDVDGGIIGGAIYGYGFAAVPDHGDLHVFAGASGKLYQGGYYDDVWFPLRAVVDLSESRTALIAPVVAKSSDDPGDETLYVATKMVGSGNNWLAFTLDRAIPDRGGITHHITIDGQGFMLNGPLSKVDISQALPRVSLATELKSEDDISDLSSVTQYTWHHGRGEKYFEDPAAYADVDGLITDIPNQVTPQLFPVVTTRTGASNPGAALVGPGGATIGNGGQPIGPAIPAVDAQNFGGYPVDDVIYNGNYWILIRGDNPADNALFYWHNTNNEWTPETAGLDVVNATPQDLEIFEEDLWVAQSDTDACRVYDKSAGAWVTASAAAYCLKSWDNKLWRADNINEIYYSSNAQTPTTATWTKLGEVDDGASTTGRIRRFETYNGTLLIFADFGVWQVVINQDLSYSLLPLLNDESQRSRTNGAAAANFGGIMYYNVGSGVTRFDGSSRSDVGPNKSPAGGEKYHTLPAAKRGDFSFMRATDNFLYMAIDAGATGRSTVMRYAGTGWSEFWQANADGQRCRWVSHTPAITTTGAFAYRNLWVEAGGTIYRIQLPRHGENPLDDSTLTYRAGGQYKLITGWQNQQLPAVEKLLHELIGRFEGFSGGQFEPNLHVYFQIDGGEDSFDTADWTYLATFSRNPGEEIDILGRAKWSALPDTYSGSIGGLGHKQIRYMLVFDMDIGGATSTQSPPVLHSFGHRFVLRTPRRYGFTAVIQAWNDLNRLDGSKELGLAQRIRNTLYDMAEQRSPHYIDDGTLPAMINWVLNPGFELDSNEDGLADAWEKLNDSYVTTSISYKHKVNGRQAQKVVVAAVDARAGIKQGSLVIPPGVKAHVEADLFVESGLGAQLLAINSATGEVIGRSKPVFPQVGVRPPAGFTTLHCHIDPREVVTTVEIQVVVPRTLADASTSTTFYVDSALLYLGETVPHYYVDGEQPRCQWVATTTTPYMSPSFRRGSYAVYITGLNEVFRQNVPTEGGENIKNSEITLMMREAAV
jgi:hypothetical protein